jgi:hypothetical protein
VISVGRNELIESTPNRLSNSGDGRSNPSLLQIPRIPIRSWVENCWSVLSSSWKPQRVRMARLRHSTKHVLMTNSTDSGR